MKTERWEKLFREFPDLVADLEKGLYSMPQRPKDEALGLAFDQGRRYEILKLIADYKRGQKNELERGTTGRPSK